MALAKATISSTVSPRIRRAVTAAATWDGVGSPRRQAEKKAWASSGVRTRPSTSLASKGLKPSMASDRHQTLDARQIEEVGDHVMAMLGGDGFRVELHAVDGPGA